MKPIYVDVAEARRLPGLRLALTQGFPAPWGFSARAFFDIKNIPFVAVIHEAGEPNDALREWTGQTSAPCAMFDDERPRSHWLEMLLLAERLVPEPRLIPVAEEERVLMIGLCTEMCSEDGLGWNLRELLLDAQQAAGQMRYPTLLMKYSSGRPVDHARARLQRVIDSLAQRLRAQHESGSEYLVGKSLTAADICWTGFSNLFEAMPHEACPMPEFYREIGTLAKTFLERPLDPILLAHRDRIVARHLRTPIEF